VNGMTSLYFVCNRGKRSMVVDMTKPEGADLVRRLAATPTWCCRTSGRASSSVSARLRRRPRAEPGVVYCSLSGFGAEGPHRDRQRVRQP